MLITNTIKIVRLPADAVHVVHPLARLLPCVGFGAAAYSPAKYGILTELLPAAAARRRQRLDRGHDGRLDHPRHAARRRARSVRTVSTKLLGLRHAAIDTGINTPPEAAICVIVVFYVHRRDLQLVHPATPASTTASPSKNPLLPDPRVLALRDAAVARQARADLARDHHAVLGRGRHAAVHRAQVGRAWRSASTCRRRRILQGVVAVGIAVGRRARRARFVSLRASVDVLPGGHRDGHRRDRDDLRARALPVARSLMIVIGALRRVLRRADERAAAASRPRADGRRPLDRRAELQREHRHPGHGRPVRVLMRHTGASGQSPRS